MPNSTKILRTTFNKVIAKKHHTGYMQDHPARSVGFSYSQDTVNQYPTNGNYYIYFCKAKVAICVGDEFD